MATSRKRHANKNRQMKLKVRTMQKISLRKVAVATTALTILVSSFIYFNFFNNQSSRAENATIAIHPDYSTSDVTITERLLVKPGANERRIASGNYKTDTAFIQKKISRGQPILASQYIAD